jgi:signal transduction histidine kinase
MKSEFISLASHQLRTPLSSIRWYAEMLTSGDNTCLSEEQRGYVQEIFTSSVRMANLIEALLHVARIESGVLVPEVHPVDLTEFLRQTCDEWQGMVREKGLTLTLSLPGHPIKTETDTVLLQIILQNLLSNALKYSEKGKSVAVSLVMQDAEAVISVTDTGIGILTEDQERVFQKFFRGKNARTIDTDGNGLGLYISRSVAKTLGADFSFVSKSGEGSTFRVSLPTGKTTGTTA